MCSQFEGNLHQYSLQSIFCLIVTKLSHNNSNALLYIGITVQCTLKFCYLEAEGVNNDQYCLHLISARLKIDLRLSLRVKDGRNIF